MLCFPGSSSRRWPGIVEGSENKSMNACMFLIAEPLLFSQLCNLSDGTAGKFSLVGKTETPKLPWQRVLRVSGQLVTKLKS